MRCHICRTPGEQWLRDLFFGRTHSHPTDRCLVPSPAASRSTQPNWSERSPCTTRASSKRCAWDGSWGPCLACRDQHSGRAVGLPRLCGSFVCRQPQLDAKRPAHAAPTSLLHLFFLQLYYCRRTTCWRRLWCCWRCCAPPRCTCRHSGPRAWPPCCSSRHTSLMAACEYLAVACLLEMAGVWQLTGGCAAAQRPCTTLHIAAAPAAHCVSIASWQFGLPLTCAHFSLPLPHPAAGTRA